MRREKLELRVEGLDCESEAAAIRRGRFHASRHPGGADTSRALEEQQGAGFGRVRASPAPGLAF